MDGFIALRRASTEFERRLCLLEANDWSRPTPCEEWDARALVNHVVGGNRRYVMLLHGASADSVNRTRTLDHLGSEPVTAFRTTAEALTAAFREDGALTRIVHHPIGDQDGAQLLAMRVLDLTVHAWDLARALGADDTLDAAAVEFALAHAEVIEAGQKHGSYAAPTGAPPSDASAQAHLLYLAGRSIEGDRW